MKQWIKKINRLAVMPFSALVYLIIFGLTYAAVLLKRVFKPEKKNPASYWAAVKNFDKENNYQSPY